MFARQRPAFPSILSLPVPDDEERFFRQMDYQLSMQPGFKTFFQYEMSLPQPAAMQTKGIWSEHEDRLLADAVNAMSPVVWDVVAEKVPGRNAVQCRERWRYRLSPDVKKTRFEDWEDELIVKERSKLGNHWTIIANKLPGRTACAVKNRWYSVLRNRNTKDL